MTWIDIIKLVLAALFGAAASLIVSWIKTDRDERSGICNNFAIALRDIADLGSEYWLLEPNDQKLTILEVKLLGGQTYLSHLRMLALVDFRSVDRVRLIGELGNFYDALTGGDFKVKNRSADFVRAEECQVKAAEIAVLIRSGLTHSNSIFRLLGRTVCLRD